MFNPGDIITSGGDDLLYVDEPQGLGTYKLWLMGRPMGPPMDRPCYASSQEVHKHCVLYTDVFREEICSE